MINYNYKKIKLKDLGTIFRGRSFSSKDLKKKGELLYLTGNKLYSDDFESNFQNAVVLSKNNYDIKMALRLFYLRNIPNFSKKTQELIISQ